MKLAALAEKTRAILPALCCPLCAGTFSLEGTQSLVCESGHCFDLSKRGYINLCPSHAQNDEYYSAELFECRRSIFQDGFYAPVMQEIGTAVGAYASADGFSHSSSHSFSLVDAGCGEGSYARYLSECFPQVNILGIDLCRDALITAARQPSPVHWIIGDVSALPLRTGSASVLLDVLTPAAYSEFTRVLASDGILIKVVPGKDYLQEIRACIQQDLRSDDYDNERVLAHLEKHAEVLERRTIRHTYPVSAAQAERFVRMTPMTLSLSAEKRGEIGFEAITVHLEMVVCRMFA